MKIVVVWFCLLTKASAFPTEPPPDSEEKKPCCVGPPQLLFKGYDSKHRINVFLFEFPPLKHGSKSKVKDENVKHSNTTSEGKAISLSSTDDENQDELAVNETNTPAYPQGINGIPKRVSHFTNVSSNTVDAQKKDSKFPGTSINLLPDNIHQQEIDLGTISSPTTVTQDDTEKYGMLGKTDIAVGDEAKNTGLGITNEQNDVDGYYSTEGITLTDVSGYSDTKVTKQDPNVNFPSQGVENGDILDCSETDSLCKSTSKYTEHRQVTHPTPHKEVHYPSGKSFELSANSTQSSKNHTNKPSGRRKKLVIHKVISSKQHGQPKMNNKQSLAQDITNRNSNYSRRQRHRHAHHDCSRNHYRYRHHRKQSSSESASDSSQQLS